MKLNKAIERLSWRFGECDNIKPNQTDLNALNEVIEYIADSKKELLSQNLLFAKLYIAVYKRTMEHYDSDVLDPIPQKELHRFLSKPIEWHYENFTEFLNQKEWLSENNLVHSPWEVEDVTNNINLQMSECLRKYSES